MAQTNTDDDSARAQGRGDEEPLLGRVGDVSQKDGKGLQYNLVLGTAIIAQIGIWILTATVWASIFIHTEILGLFSAHPLLNITALLLTTQAILLLQPTHTPTQKRPATHIHALLNSLATLSLLTAFIIIEYNKFAHSAPHFTSVHGKLGLITFCLFMLQAAVGLTQFYTPQLYPGGREGAKKVYKYHRMSGYVGLVMGFATVAAATQTGTGGGALGLRLWVVLVTSGLVVVGVGARIKRVKLGL